MTSTPPDGGRPRRSPGVLATTVDDDLVLWNPFDRTSHVLNRTARDVWDLLDGRRTVGAIVDQLAATYAVDRSTVRAGTVELLHALRASTLVDGTERDAPAPAWPEALPTPDALDAAHERAVAGHGWQTTTDIHSAFDFRFTLHDETELTATALDATFAPLAAPTPPTPARAEEAVPPAHRYTIRVRPRGRLALALDGHRLCVGTPASVSRHLIWHVNRLAVASVPTRVVLHAAGVQREGRTLLLPAAMDSGKSTLTAALVRRGWDYLSDEALAVEPASGVVHPYPRAISLDRGSWPVLPELRPDDPELATGRLVGGWHVSPRAVRANSVGHASVAHAVVFPRYRPGARAALEAASPTEAVTALLAQSFDFGAVGQAGLDRLRALAELPAYRLDLDDLDEAERVLRDLVAGLTPPSPG